jgi:tetratricopeptide (TPR) repeat protein
MTRGNARLGLFLLVTLLAGCASGPGSIYVPAGGGGQARSSASGSDEQAAPVQKPAPRVSEPSAPEPAPRYQDQSEALSPAARSLIQKADSLLRAGNPQGAISQLERAQRISPRSAEVYFHLARAYAGMQRYGAGEQFARKGLSLAGSNTGLQKQGWMLLADIRRASGNVAGADQAEARASAL